MHVAQFACAAILLAGLVALPFAVSGEARTRWAGRFGAASAVVALALYGVLQAVDGVGNKEVDDAWVSAPNAEKAARFASAEAMRWLEVRGFSLKLQQRELTGRLGSSGEDNRLDVTQSVVSHRPSTLPSGSLK